jgi:aldose 1-epimerase
MNITVSDFGFLPDGRKAQLFTLDNEKGMIVKITNYGGIITSLCLPDREGKPGDIVLGFDSLTEYLNPHPYFGAVIGRFANRIAGGVFRLNGNEYRLKINNGPNHLQGGLSGLDKKLWRATKDISKDKIELKLACESADMEEGYPGNLMVETVYSLNEENELGIEYHAKSDKDTIINLTNHSYFNLNGMKKTVHDHILQLDANFYTPADESNIPTGELRSVENTAFDFRNPRALGAGIQELEAGYDHNFVLNKPDNELSWFASLKDPFSGRVMEAATTQPGVQLYTSYYVRNIKGKNNMIYQPFSAVCLETQHFPDSPNKDHFPGVILRSGEKYFQKTIYKFNH